MKHEYTVEVYKKDNRFKGGERLVEKFDASLVTKEQLDWNCAKKYRERDGYRYTIHETYVERTNYLTGNKYMERYDTPYYCSASSETYWSM